MGRYRDYAEEKRLNQKHRRDHEDTVKHIQDRINSGETAELIAELIQCFKFPNAVRDRIGVKQSDK